MKNDYSEITRQLGKYKNVQGLMRYINVESLKEQHEKQSEYKAVGIDKVTKIEYEKNLTENLTVLIDRMKSFSYHPQPVKRVYIPKANGKLRPLGIPSYEDKLVQGVMAEILNEIYEPIFLDCSYGFRPGRDCHQAIKQLDEYIMRGKTNYIVDADIKGFFDHVNHDWLVKFLEHEIKDKTFLRYIKRFLKAGIMDKGNYQISEEGTPQGGLISPILANVYLHYVLDLWFELYVKVKCKGKCHLVRYADDFVACFELEDEANWFYQELIERLAKFNLEIEANKTKIFPFGRNDKDKHSFDFLGFNIYNSKTRGGYFKCGYRTSDKKSKLIYAKINEFIKENMHSKPKTLIKMLNKRLVGIFNYYGISFNMEWMNKLRHYVVGQLKFWLNRRSQKDKTNWEKMNKIMKKDPIVKPKISFSLL